MNFAVSCSPVLLEWRLLPKWLVSAQHLLAAKHVYLLFCLMPTAAVGNLYHSYPHGTMKETEG